MPTTEVDEEYPFTEEHEYNASKIVGYRPAPDVPGGYEFKTQWEGFGRTNDSWEPAVAFVPRYTQCFVNFLKRRKIRLEVTDVCVPKRAGCPSLPPRGSRSDEDHVSYSGSVRSVTGGWAQSAWDYVHTGGQGASSHLPQSANASIYGRQPIPGPPPHPLTAPDPLGVCVPLSAGVGCM